MASTTNVTAVAGAAWTLAYTAAGAVTIGVQNRHKNSEVLVRVGASAATGDSPDASALLLFPNEYRTLTLANGDKVFTRPLSADENAIVVVLA